jgi:transposase-like protein
VTDATPRHAPPFYCPYCGEENIRPYGEEKAQYRCGACLRVWTLRLVGTTTKTDVTHSTETEEIS